MKKYMKLLLIPVFAFVVTGFNGCILDAFDTLTQGFPISVDLNLTGVGEVSATQTFNLDESDFYKNNQTKIQNIKLVKIAYRTKTAPVPANLQGDVVVSLAKANGDILFTKTIPNIRPGDYTDQAYELELSQSQIQLVNAYIGTLSNKTLKATVSVTNVNSAVTVNLQAIVDVVFEMEYKL